MATVLVRISSGEVIKISPKNQAFSDRNKTYFSVLTDPSRPDGDNLREQKLDGTEGLMRQLGFAKVAVDGVVRNATRAEIDNFAGMQDDDDSRQDADQATSFIDIDPLWRKLIKALLKFITKEVIETSNVKTNALIEQWSQHKVDIANAATLADLKTATAALPMITSNLSTTITVDQAVTRLKSRITKDD